MAARPAAGRACQVQPQVDAVAVGQRGQLLHGVQRRSGEVDGFELAVGIAVLGLGHQQQLVGDVDQAAVAGLQRLPLRVHVGAPGSGVLAVLVTLVVLARVARVFGLRGLQRQRRAQLVRGVGNEAALRLAGRLQCQWRVCHHDRAGRGGAGR